MPLDFLIEVKNENKCKLLALFCSHIEGIFILKNIWHFVSPTALKKAFAQNKHEKWLRIIMLNLRVHDLNNVFLISQFNGNFEHFFAIKILKSIKW